MRLPRQNTRAQSRRPSAGARAVRARRPVAQRRTPGSTAPHRPDRRRHGFTTRAVVLAVALCAVLLTLAVPLQQYVAQRGQLAGLSAEERAAKERVSALEKAQAQWQDPAYIKQQARERLHFVKPGETAYVLVDPDAPKTATP